MTNPIVLTAYNSSGERVKHSTAKTITAAMKKAETFLHGISYQTIYQISKVHVWKDGCLISIVGNDNV